MGQGAGRGGFSIDADIRPPAHGGRRAVVSGGNDDQRAVLSRHLAARGFQVSQADGTLDALSIIGTEAPSVALLHSEADGDDGDRAAALAALLYPRTRILVTTGAGASGEGPFPVLRHPVDPAQLDRWLDESPA